MAYSIYTITVTKFNEHNSGLKKGHKATLISNNFCDDSKLGTLPVTVRWLFLGIILTCGDHTRDTVEMNERQLRALLESSWSIDRALASLEELQLLSYQKTPPNRIEKNRKEEKRKETKGTHAVAKQPAVVPTEKTNLVVARYCELWKNLYGASPMIGGRVSGQLKTLTKDFGVEKSCQLIEAYLQMPDQWFVTKRHDIPTLISNLNAVSQFIETGKIFTRKEISQLDKAVSDNNLAKEIMENGI